MTGKISRCNSCGKFFDSKRDLKDHIDNNHRITNSSVLASGIPKHAAASLSSSKKSTGYDEEKIRDMKKMSPPLFLFGILGIIIILLVPLTTLSPSQTPSAYAIEKDFCLEATSPDGDTIEDCSDKPKFCRSLSAFYENQGFTITQKCRAQVTGE